MEDKYISVKLSGEGHGVLKQYATHHGLSIAEAVRKIFDETPALEAYTEHPVSFQEIAPRGGKRPGAGRKPKT